MVELADFYDVDIREIFDGKRKSEIMEKDLKETLVKVSEYSNSEKKTKARKLNILFACGLILIVLGTLSSQFDILSQVINNNHITQGLSGAMYGLGIGFEMVAFCFNNSELGKR